MTARIEEWKHDKIQAKSLRWPPMTLSLRKQG